MTASVHVPPVFLLELLTFLLFGFLAWAWHLFAELSSGGEDACGLSTAQDNIHSKRKADAPSSSSVVCLLRPPFSLFLSSFLLISLLLLPFHPPSLNARRANVTRYSSVAKAGYGYGYGCSIPRTRSAFVM